MGFRGEVELVGLEQVDCQGDVGASESRWLYIYARLDATWSYRISAE